MVRSHINQASLAKGNNGGQISYRRPQNHGLHVIEPCDSQTETLHIGLHKLIPMWARPFGRCSSPRPVHKKAWLAPKCIPVSCGERNAGRWVTLDPIWRKPKDAFNNDCSLTVRLGVSVIYGQPSGGPRSLRFLWIIVLLIRKVFTAPFTSRRQFPLCCSCKPGW